MAKVVVRISLTNIISRRIKSLCRKRKLSINKLASMSGLSYSTINSIIRGSSKSPTLATLVRIATAFNMTIVEFLDVPEIIAFSFDDEESDDSQDEKGKSN